MRSRNSDVARVRRVITAVLTVVLVLGVMAPALASAGSLRVKNRSDQVVARAEWSGTATTPVGRRDPRVERQLSILASDEVTDGRVVCVKVELQQGNEPWRQLKDDCAKREPRSVRTKVRLRWDRRLECQARISVRTVGRTGSVPSESVRRACDRI
jgi:hypothetical protein